MSSCFLHTSVKYGRVVAMYVKTLAECIFFLPGHLQHFCPPKPPLGSQVKRTFNLLLKNFWLALRKNISLITRETRQLSRLKTSCLPAHWTHEHSRAGCFCYYNGSILSCEICVVAYLKTHCSHDSCIETHLV
jgi:hypothetical protein